MGLNRQVFRLPDLGEGLTEAELVRWLVDPGDRIDVDTPVAEVETAKAVVEVPSPYGGLVAELHGDKGTTLRVGEPLISVDSEEPTGSTNVLVGYGASPEAPSRRRRNRRSAGSTPVAARAAARPATRSPVVRKLARDLGVDLTTLTGSGPEGQITRQDVERAATAPNTREPSVEPSTEGGTDERTGLPIRERVAFDGVRKAIARTLSRSRQEIPEATAWVDVDATNLINYRKSLADERDGGPGLTALVARFVVAGLLRYPVFNARVEHEHLVRFDGVNLGIATQTDRGLVVPAVRGAHLLSARQLDAEIRRVVRLAREGTASPTDLTSGSFTFNNYGRFNVDGSAAIINHPEVAILGMGRVLQRPWVVDDEIVPRHITQLSLVFDHRVCDAGTASGFLRFVADALESPISALADL